MKRLMEWRPLIIGPLLPLMWMSCWLTYITIARGMAIRTVKPAELQESLLLISGVVVVINIYNLVLIYHETTLIKTIYFYSILAISFAVTIICSMVLAWSDPARILTPEHLSAWTVIFVLLTAIQGLMGNYFALVTRQQVTIENPRSSLVLASTCLTLTSLIAVPALTDGVACRRGWVVLLLLFLIANTVLGIVNLNHLFKPLAVQQSVTYKLLVGINLSSFFISILTGLDTVTVRWISPHFALLAVCMLTALTVYGISTAVIAGMQRYDNDYRYGHVNGRERLWVVVGAILFMALLLIECYVLSV